MPTTEKKNGAKNAVQEMNMIPRIRNPETAELII
jgi:hypothetical protein